MESAGGREIIAERAQQRVKEVIFDRGMSITVGSGLRSGARERIGVLSKGGYDETD